MLGLNLQTDPKWVNIVENDIHEILIDRTLCDKKAASTSISFIVQFPELSYLVKDIAITAQEEMGKFTSI